MSGDAERGFQVRTFAAADGLQLYARDYGHDDPRTAARLPVVCLPGLTRNSRDFHPLALILSQDADAPRRVVTLDARGRGRSAWDKDKSHYNLGVESQDVLTACATLGIAKAIFIGTSRGGLVLHILAATRPDILGGVVLNDIGPLLQAEGLKDIRDYLNRGRKPADWDDAVAILRQDHGATFTTLSERDWQEMAHAVYAEIDGRIVADADPAIARIIASLDLDGPQPDLWPQFEGFKPIPLMAIRGANSRLLSNATLQEMAERHENMTALTVPGHGHPPLLHLEGIAAAIKAFADKADAA